MHHESQAFVRLCPPSALIQDATSLVGKGVRQTFIP
jgi:hypothetical protein